MMCRMRIFRYAAVITVSAFFLCAACGDSFARVMKKDLTNDDLPDREGVKVGKMLVHTAMKVDEDLETNIYLANSDRKFDAITILSPSVGFELPLRENKIAADYQADVYLYGKYDTENHVDHHIRAIGELNATDYKFVVNDIYNVMTSRAANENSLRIRQYINDLRFGASAQFELLGVEVGYTNKLEAYGSEDIMVDQLTYEDKDRFNNIIDATVSYRCMPKTLLLLENDIGFIHYYNSSQPPDSYFDETLIGIRGEWFHRSNVNFRAGFRYQSYDTSDVFSDKPFVGPVLRGGFDYRPTDRDTVLINAERANYESTYSTMNYYTANMIGASYRHDFTDKISSSIFGSYQLHMYPSETTENGVTAKRYDNLYWAGASVRYDIRKWFSVEAKYQYTQKVSRFDAFNYYDNVASIKGTVGF